ncbi:hypothetical protein C8J57DRAFT_1402935 [Mycena rebaudengoi]|nr:hypothetical protein C8J57DRAFT_1402935 [Mycena rebaudengoi]
MASALRGAFGAPYDLSQILEDDRHSDTGWSTVERRARREGKKPIRTTSRTSRGEAELLGSQSEWSTPGDAGWDEHARARASSAIARERATQESTSEGRRIRDERSRMDRQLREQRVQDDAELAAEIAQRELDEFEDQQYAEQLARSEAADSGAIARLAAAQRAAFEQAERVHHLEERIKIERAASERQNSIVQEHARQMELEEVRRKAEQERAARKGNRCAEQKRRIF